MRRVRDPRLPAWLEGPVIRYGARVEIWRNGEKLIDDLPISDGKVTATGDVIESVQFSATAPLPDQLRPRSPYDALAGYGQQARVVPYFIGPAGDEIPVPLGWFRLDRPDVDGSTVTMTGRDRTAVYEQSRLSYPRMLNVLSCEQHIRRAGEGMLPRTVIDPDTPVDPTLGRRFSYRSRLELVQSALERWGAVMYVDEFGVPHVRRPAQASDPVVLTFRDGATGTTVKIDRQANPSVENNACIATGVDAYGAQVWGAAYVTTGPMAWPTDPFGSGNESVYGMRPGFYSSPLITTYAAARATAASILARWQRGVAGTFKVEATPDPRLRPEDVVRVIKNADRPTPEIVTGLVTSVELPLVPGELMTVEGAVL